jgi:hypothetical protein
VREAFRTALKDPIYVYQGEHVREVWVFTRWAYRMDALRRWVVVVRPDPDGEVRPIAATYDVGRPFRGWAWLTEFFVRPAVREVYGPEAAEAQAFGRGGHGLRPYTRKLIPELRGWFNREALRRQIAQAMHLDPAVVEIARRIRPRHRDGYLAQEDYGLAWRHFDTLARVRREAPNLLRPVALALAAHEVEEGRDVVAHLKLRLRRYGLTEVGWRLLAAASPRLFDAALAAADDPPLRTIVAVATVLADLRLPFVPSARLVACMVEVFTRVAGRRRLRFGPEWQAQPRWFLRAAAVELERRRGDAPATAAFRADFLRAEHWARSANAEPDANQRRAGWAWVTRAREAWEARRRVAAASGQPLWAGPFPEGDIEVEGCRVRALTTPLDLWDESVALRHCLFGYRTEMHGGRFAAFSVAEGAGRQRRATVGLQFKDGPARWVVHQVRGFANAPMQGVFWRVAQVLAARMPAHDCPFVCPFDPRRATSIEDVEFSLLDEIRDVLAAEEEPVCPPVPRVVCRVPAEYLGQVPAPALVRRGGADRLRPAMGGAGE